MKKKLLIISHTEHYYDTNNQVVGWGPTVREINFIAQHFEEVYHCAPLHVGAAPKSCLTYNKTNVSFVPLEPSGGDNLSDKIKIILSVYNNTKLIASVLKKVDLFQLRTPTGMGIYLIPYLNIFHRKKIGWYKYAGNWAQEKPPLGYAIQRFLLKKQKLRKVTINGSWINQQPQCLTFENPCLTEEELNIGNKLLNEKKYDDVLNFCFVGRLESEKGVRRILQAFIHQAESKKINKLYLVGDGPEREEFEKLADKIKCEVVFCGYVSRFEVGEIMKKSHVFLLPSTASEGFPKVIAEAANYGCIPIVSDVSSISQYVIDGKNGFLCDHTDRQGTTFNNKLKELLEYPNLHDLAIEAAKLAMPFTFEHYSNRILNEIISSHDN